MATLTRRVELLEEQMEGLAGLPVRVTRVEERLTGVEGRLTQVENELGALRVEMRGEFGRVWAEFDRVRQEIRSGDEETRNLMRILHEEVIERFKLLKEHIDRVNGGPRDGKQ